MNEGIIAQQAYLPDLTQVLHNNGDVDTPNHINLKKTKYESFMNSKSSGAKEDPNSDFNNIQEQPKGIALRRFSKIKKAIEVAEYETLQVFYRLLFQSSASDTKPILTQRILGFSGFYFDQNEEYIKREMMLHRQPKEFLVKLGAILGLPQLKKMLLNKDSGREDLISSIMYFLSRPNRRTHSGTDIGSLVNEATGSQDPQYANLKESKYENFTKSKSYFVKEHPKGIALRRFNKIKKAIEVAEYETLQVLYRLLFNQSALHTKTILTQRILGFRGFYFDQNEEYIKREMMLRTLPKEVLVKLGAILGLGQLQKMLSNTDGGMEDLISSIMYFLSRPNRKAHSGTDSESSVTEEPNSQVFQSVMVPIYGAVENIIVTPIIDPSYANTSNGSEIIVPDQCVVNEPEVYSLPKKVKLSSSEDSKPINIKIKQETNSDEEDKRSSQDSKPINNIIKLEKNSDDNDCEMPLSSLLGHPIDSVLKKHIVDIVKESNLASITINGVIKKIFNMYPDFDLSYKKEFIKSTLRLLLYDLGQQNSPYAAS